MNRPQKSQICNRDSSGILTVKKLRQIVFDFATRHILKASFGFILLPVHVGSLIWVNMYSIDFKLLNCYKS